MNIFLIEDYDLLKNMILGIKKEFDSEQKVSENQNKNLKVMRLHIFKYNKFHKLCYIF